MDRVDALLVVYDAVPVARAAALLLGARELLGRVVRDPAVIADVLGDGRGDALARRSAAVALGLLGVIPPLAAAVPDPTDAAELRAFCLAAVLAGGVVGWAAVAAALREVERAAVGGPAQQAASVARQRFAAGALVRVVG